MLTNVSTTSADTYHAIRRDGSLTRQQAQIMAVIEAGRDYSRREIAYLADMETSSVAGRVNELLASEVLEAGRTRPCSYTGKTVHAVRRPAGPVQRALF